MRVPLGHRVRDDQNAAPRIAVAELNPHADDGGTLGREEIELIAPAVSRARADGIVAHGPLAAATKYAQKFITPTAVPAR